MAPPRDEPRTGAGNGGDDGGKDVDVGALKAEVNELRLQWKRTEERQRRTERRQAAIVRAITRGAEFTAGEMELLLAD